MGCVFLGFSVKTKDTGFYGFPGPKIQECPERLLSSESGHSAKFIRFGIFCNKQSNLLTKKNGVLAVDEESIYGH